MFRVSVEYPSHSIRPQVLYSNVIAAVEMFMLLEQAHAALGLQYKHLNEFLEADFMLPGGQPRQRSNSTSLDRYVQFARWVFQCFALWLHNACSAEVCTALTRDGMASIFNEARQAASITVLKASASELLGVYPAVRYFVETVLHSSDIVAGRCPFF